MRNEYRGRRRTKAEREFTALYYAPLETDMNKLATINTPVPTGHVELAKRQLMPEGSTDLELEWFGAWCKARGLDPISGDVWAMKSGGKLVIQATIQGLRAIAEQSGGIKSTHIEWSADGEVWVGAWVRDERPAAARVTITTMDDRIFQGVAVYRERAQKGPTWEKMASHMLAKVAEADALRRAFPRVCGSIYTPDEMPPTEPVQVKSPRVSADELRDRWDNTQQVLKELGLSLMPEPGNVARAKELLEDADRRIEEATR
jgi:hypothetical protein